MFFRKISVAIVLTLAVTNLLAFSVVPASAQTIGGDIGKQLAATQKGAGFEDARDPREIVAQIIRIVLGLLGTIFFVLTIYAGFLWMTAAGNEEQATKAKTLLTQAVIGLVIILTAYSITYFVLRLALGQPGTDWGNSAIIEPPSSGPSGY
ncbi:MAG: hypothetical protein WCV83_03370 [Candidatus Magasanikbacteria bacterium]|jgi:amino acid transporter